MDLFGRMMCAVFSIRAWEAWKLYGTMDGWMEVGPLHERTEPQTQTDVLVTSQ